MALVDGFKMLDQLQRGDGGAGSPLRVRVHVRVNGAACQGYNSTHST